MLSVSIQVLQRKGARCGVISIKDTSETSGGVSVGAIRQTEGEAEFGQRSIDKLGVSVWSRGLSALSSGLRMEVLVRRS